VIPIVYFEDLEVGSVHLGRECVCDKDENAGVQPTQ